MLQTIALKFMWLTIFNDNSYNPLPVGGVPPTGRGFRVGSRKVTLFVDHLCHFLKNWCKYHPSLLISIEIKSIFLFQTFFTEKPDIDFVSFYENLLNFPKKYKSGRLDHGTFTRYMK